ncbi:uncharacterized protein G2W53_024248 [Senna tora]|uniref:Uncharacterized protein n=1 Tax=Senna tora TaxID=362788 RepID=A0A834WFA9_9FABA|nr:uncharacterized protein G2W53_024248 [Senna tora]
MDVEVDDHQKRWGPSESPLEKA